MMKRLILASTLLLMVSATSGCVFYGGDDEPCPLYDPVPGSGLRVMASNRSIVALPPRVECPGQW